MKRRKTNHTNLIRPWQHYWHNGTASSIVSSDKCYTKLSPISENSLSGSNQWHSKSTSLWCLIKHEVKQYKPSKATFIRQSELIGHVMRLLWWGNTLPPEWIFHQMSVELGIDWWMLDFVKLHLFFIIYIFFLEDILFLDAMLYSSEIKKYSLDIPYGHYSFQLCHL